MLAEEFLGGLPPECFRFQMSVLSVAAVRGEVSELIKIPIPKMLIVINVPYMFPYRPT